MPGWSFCPQQGFGSGVGVDQLLAGFSFCLFGLKAEIPICTPQPRSHRLKGWGVGNTTRFQSPAELGLWEGLVDTIPLDPPPSGQPGWGRT